MHGALVPRQAAKQSNAIIHERASFERQQQAATAAISNEHIRFQLKIKSPPEESETLYSSVSPPLLYLLPLYTHMFSSLPHPIDTLFVIIYVSSFLNHHQIQWLFDFLEKHVVETIIMRIDSLKRPSFSLERKSQRARKIGFVCHRTVKQFFFFSYSVNCKILYSC